MSSVTGGGFFSTAEQYVRARYIEQLLVGAGRIDLQRTVASSNLQPSRALHIFELRGGEGHRKIGESQGAEMETGNNDHNRI